MIPMAIVGRKLAEDRSKCPDCSNHSDQNFRSGKAFVCQIHADGTRRRKLQQNPRTPYRQPFSSPSGESKLPGELTAVAVFRCLRLRSRRDGAGENDELAYQTSMSIGGRKFKGILYDQGPEGCFEPVATAAAAASGGASGGLLPTYLPPLFPPAV